LVKIKGYIIRIIAAFAWNIIIATARIQFFVEIQTAQTSSNSSSFLLLTFSSAFAFFALVVAIASLTFSIAM